MRVLVQRVAAAQVEIGGRIDQRALVGRRLRLRPALRPRLRGPAGAGSVRGDARWQLGKSRLATASFGIGEKRQKRPGKFLFRGNSWHPRGRGLLRVSDHG